MDTGRLGLRALGAVALLFGLSKAYADVNVEIVGDTALATISLTDTSGHVFAADVTIIFDTPSHLTAASLNLTAELVDPTAIQPRLPLPPPMCHGHSCTAGAEIDPAFPLMVTVEPPAVSWLFADSFDGNDVGNLSFLNTYEIEIHTHDLVYYDNSPYRLFKAPVDGLFYDITSAVAQGSFRARGRGGAFSQFVLAKVSQSGADAWPAKIVQLRDRIDAATIDDNLRTALNARLDVVESLLPADIAGAIAELQTLNDLITANAGVGIPNEWTATHETVNDAGVMDETSATLQFSMENPSAPTWCNDRGGSGGACGGGS